MTSNADSIVNDVDAEMKIQHNEEMLKCFTIAKMTDQETRLNTVQFNHVALCVNHNFFLFFVIYCLFVCFNCYVFDTVIFYSILDNNTYT